jgi:hypothetical protein
MKTNNQKSIFKVLTLFTMLAIVAIFSSACNSFKRTDMAVRIKSDSAVKYNRLYDRDSNVVGVRNGNTLRGSVLKVVKQTTPTDCKFDENTKFVNKTYILFLDSMAKDVTKAELIPIEDIDLQGPKVKDLPLNEYSNINWFEIYNNPKDPKEFKEVAMDSTYKDSCNKCNCQSFDVAFNLNFNLKCPDCKYSWYFVELRAGMAIYNDMKIQNITESRDAYFGELALGYRFNSWGIGLDFGTGVPVYNEYKQEDYQRPWILLHLRKQFDKFACMYPFIYGQFGMSIDKLTVDLFKVSTCKDCETKIDVKPPGADISIPLSFGFGLGLDIPIPSCLFDLSADIGFKSMAIGESISAAGFSNVPSLRRLNMFVFRLGLTFGY